MANGKLKQGNLIKEKCLVTLVGGIEFLKPNLAGRPNLLSSGLGMTVGGEGGGI